MLERRRVHTGIAADPRMMYSDGNQFVLRMSVRMSVNQGPDLRRSFRVPICGSEPLTESID
jgi:hypothetical protein